MFRQTQFVPHPGIRPGANANQLVTYAHLVRKINNEKDLNFFRSTCPGYKNILKFVNLLIDHVLGKGNQTLNARYTIKHETFKKCDSYLNNLIKLSDETDLNSAQNASYNRFGHLAYRNWFDMMKQKTREFVDSIVTSQSDKKYADELFYYASESFGNRSRIDYGTGHELHFSIFLMGLMHLMNEETKLVPDENFISDETLTKYVEKHGWDILKLMLYSYLKVCRTVQKKFRLEPAGSRGVYNMDDFQYLPFLFGAAQLVGQKFISASNFYEQDQVDMFKSEFVFIDAVSYILETKRGPFNEHSYTLWEYSNLGCWENILRRIRSKFVDEVLRPFPIVQHLLFGEFVFRWTLPDSANKKEE